MNLRHPGGWRVSLGVKLKVVDQRLHAVLHHLTLCIDLYVHIRTYTYIYVHIHTYISISSSLNEHPTPSLKAADQRLHVVLHLSLSVHTYIFVHTHIHIRIYRSITSSINQLMSLHRVASIPPGIA